MIAVKFRSNEPFEKTHTRFATIAEGFATRSLMFSGRSEPWLIRAIESN